MKLTKSKTPNKPHCSLIFYYYRDYLKLDVIGIRDLKADKAKIRFLGTIKPHKPVAMCTIAKMFNIVTGDRWG